MEDFVTEDNPVRVVDVFVEQLDLNQLGFKSVQPLATGRPAYHPAVLLKLYIYGYLNRIQSSRQLERESKRNLELFWLTERLKPDFKTIANFRKDNGPAIRKVCSQFVMLCRQLNLFAEATVAIDGSKFKAYNSCRNRHCPKCQASAAKRWLEARQADLLPVAYYHVVFTLPAPISAIAYTNKAVIYGLLFEIAAETLRTIAADPKHLGAQIGATLVLHTGDRP